jgi:2-methylcitrate dehydratase PrpD
MMSIPYGAVIALAKKEAGLAQYKEEIVLSEDIQNLLKKVVISEDEELTSLLPDIRGSKVEVIAKGKKYESRIDYSLGEPENPMSDDDIIEKFLGLTTIVGVNKNTARMALKKVFDGIVITTL